MRVGSHCRKDFFGRGVIVLPEIAPHSFVRLDAGFDLAVDFAQQLKRDALRGWRLGGW